MALQALDRPLLPREKSGAGAAGPLCRPLLQRRDRQQLLPSAVTGNLAALAGTDPRRLRLHLQGEPLYHPHEEAEGPRSHPAAVPGRVGLPREQTESGGLPAATALALRSGAPGGFLGSPAGKATLRVRVPRRVLAESSGLRRLGRARRRLLHLRFGRTAISLRGHSGLRLSAPARPENRL